MWPACVCLLQCFNKEKSKKSLYIYIYIYIYTCIYNIYVYIILFFKLGNRIYSNTVKFEADLHWVIRTDHLL